MHIRMYIGYNNDYYVPKNKLVIVYRWSLYLNTKLQKKIYKPENDADHVTK